MDPSAPGSKIETHETISRKTRRPSLLMNEFTRRGAYDKGVGRTVMSIVGMVCIRLAAPGIDMTAIAPFSETFPVSDW